MSLLEKVKLLLKLNKNWKVIVEEVEEIADVKKKSGFRSTEFLMTLAASVGAILASVAGALPPLYAAIAVSVSGVAYTVSRGVAKSTDPNGGDKPGYKTSEFFVGLLSDLGALLASVSGVLPPEIAASLVVASRVAYSLSRGLAKQP